MNSHYYYHRGKERVSLRSSSGKASPLDSDSWNPTDWGLQLRQRESMGCSPPCSSRPVVDINTTIDFSPAEIPMHEVECSYSTSNQKKEGVNLIVCFQVKSLISQFQGQCCPPAPQRCCPPRAPRSATIHLLPVLPAQGPWLPTSLTLCSWMGIGPEAGACSQEGPMNSAGTQLSPQTSPASDSSSTSR